MFGYSKIARCPGGGGGVNRDFSQSARERLKSIAKEVEDEPFWDVSKWDIWYKIEQLGGHLNLDDYGGKVDEYYRKQIDINNASVQKIDEIFDKAIEIDGTYGGKIARFEQLLRNAETRINEAAAAVEPCIHPIPKG